MRSMCLSGATNEWYGIMVEILIIIYAFVGIALVCDDYLVISLETLCDKWNVREDIAGATFAAFGSAAPEIVINAATTIKATTGGGEDADAVNLGVGAIIGASPLSLASIHTHTHTHIHTKHAGMLWLKIQHACSLFLIFATHLLSQVPALSLSWSFQEHVACLREAI